MKRQRFISGCLLMLSWATPLQAHQLGMALFQISPDTLHPGGSSTNTAWNIHSELPLGGRQQAPHISLVTPGHCQIHHGPASRVDDRLLRNSHYVCDQSWLSQTLQVAGLDPQIPDALVQIRLADGQQQFHSLTRHKPAFVLKNSAKPPQLGQYFGLGLEHIAGGLDHLLFVLLLFFCCRGLQLLWSITGFTLAHAISLASVLMGGLSMPAVPVETLIALSLGLLAAELLRRHAGQAPGWTLRYPMLMAFAFGLIHGLGFADALQQLGLPPQAQWQALLLFNLGIELGQLLLVGVLLIVQFLIRHVDSAQRHRRLRAPMLYAIGVLALFWSWQRLALL